MTLPKYQQEIVDLMAAGKLTTGDAYINMPRRGGRRTIANVVNALAEATDTGYQCKPGEDPTAMAEEFMRHGRDIEHIDEHGVITFAVPETSASCPSDVPRDKAGTARGHIGLNTDDFSQTPTIDADRSAEWNRKAKTVKPGSFAARRMAAEE